MRFKAKKIYGKSKELSCPFCGGIATQKNKQGLDVCRHHTQTLLEEIKCLCGSWLETKCSQHGPYFKCINCGNISYSKGMEIKLITGSKDSMSRSKTETGSVRPTILTRSEPKEINISTNDIEYF